MLSFLASFLLGLVGLVVAKSSAGDNVLVVLESSRAKADFSIFFSDLEERGYNLSFRAPKDAAPAILNDDIPAFDHVILFASESKSYAPDITPQSLLRLISHGTNLLVALSPKQTPMNSLAAEFSLILPPPETPLISHFPRRNHPPSLLSVDVPDRHPILSSGLSPVWFSGIPHAFGSNPYIVPILHAPSESFAADSTDDSGAGALVDASEKAGEGLWAGRSLGVVSGFQTKENSRVLWVGGIEVFSNEYMKKELSKGIKSGNRDFARDVSSWVFQESLVLRIDNSTHHHYNETAPRDHYTINDKLVFTAHVSQWNPKAPAWEPYSGLRDLQLEFTMLDPHIRTSLPPVQKSPGKYSVTFRAPDRFGVFKFVIDYKRKGLTYLQQSTTVSIVPLRHDEHPRFISAAWPYYVGVISTSVGFVLFSALWLSGDVREANRKGKGKGKIE